VNSLNYITPTGLKKIQDELHKLLKVERPALVKTVAWAAGNGDRSENADYTYGKKRLREIDKRVHFLTSRLDNIELIDPSTIDCDFVSFGATVTVADEENVQVTYKIVGEDEYEPSQKKISWKSPLAKALLKKKEGDVVVVQKPKGAAEIEIIKIEYI
jgi:transcription elongation factor GreB